MDNYTEVFNTICRVCMTANNCNTVSLFDKSKDESLSCYGKAILSFASVSITAADGLPKNMCHSCLYLLKQAIKFKFKCEDSHKIFEQIISKQETGNYIEEVVDYVLFKQYFPKNNTKKDEKILEEIIKENCDLFDSASDSDYSKIDTHNYDSETVNSDNENENNSHDSIDSSRLSDTKDLIQKANDSEAEDNIIEAIEQFLDTCHDSNNDIDTQKVRVRHVKREKTKNKKRRVLVKKITPCNFTCPVCQKVLANQKTFDNHMQRHNGFRYICELCGKGFPTNPELQSHLVVRHGIGKCYQCEHCTFKAPRKFDLMEHNRVHTGERPFACEQCGLTFRRRCVWRKHRLYHQDKTLQCPQCPRRFHVRADLSAHTNNVHARRYVFACARCAATYAKPGSVRRHLALAHGVPRHLQGRIIRINRGEGVDFPE